MFYNYNIIYLTYHCQIFLRRYVIIILIIKKNITPKSVTFFYKYLLSTTVKIYIDYHIIIERLNSLYCGKHQLSIKIMSPRLKHKLILHPCFLPYPVHYFHNRNYFGMRHPGALGPAVLYGLDCGIKLIFKSCYLCRRINMADNFVG